MPKRLPFIASIFWKILAVVALLIVVAWAIAVKIFGYEMQPQDYPGSAISGVIFAYLVHLWLMPEETNPPDSQ